MTRVASPFARWKQHAELFRNIPPRSLLIFYCAVACLFAANGVVTDILNIDSSSGPLLAFRSLTSAFIAVGWAFFGIRRMVRSMVIYALCQAIFFYSVGKLMPDVHHALTVQQMRNAIILRAFLINALIAIGYSLFLTFFRFEGRRFFAAHTEIQLAATIHRALVPPISISYNDLEIYGLSVPSGAVGGDLLDVVHHPEACLAYIADVSGHGVKAGVLMSMIKTSVRTRFITAPPCANGFLEDLNQVLYPLMDAPSFATLGFIVFEPGGVTRFSLAGQLPVFHWHSRTRQIEQHSIDNLPVAMFPVTRFAVGQLDPEPGDVLALVTDGLTEIFDKRGEELGSAYIETALEQLAGRPLKEIADRILERGEKFGPITDDRTLLLIRVSG